MCWGMCSWGIYWWVSIGSDNGLVPSGTKPLSEPILTQFPYASIYSPPCQEWVILLITHLCPNNPWKSFFIMIILKISLNTFSHNDTESISPSIQHEDIMTWRFFHISNPLCGESTSNPMDSPHKGIVMWWYDASFIVNHNKLLNKQLSCQWF